MIDDVKELREQLDKERALRLLAEDKLRLSGRSDSQLILDVLRRDERLREVEARCEVYAEQVRAGDEPMRKLKYQLDAKNEQIAELNMLVGRLYAQTQKGKASK